MQVVSSTMGKVPYKLYMCLSGIQKLKKKKKYVFCENPEKIFYHENFSVTSFEIEINCKSTSLV